MMSSMDEVLQSLAETGYTGDCLAAEHLGYAIRVGACSWQYLELVSWLEQKFVGCHESTSSYGTEFEFAPLFKELRSSYLKISSGAPSDPVKLRWTILEYLINVLEMVLEKKRNCSNLEEVLNKQQTRELRLMQPAGTGVAFNATQSVRLQRAESNKLLADSKASEYQSKTSDIAYPDSECAKVYTSFNYDEMLHFIIIKEESPTGEISKTHWRHIKSKLDELFLPAVENDSITSAEANGIYFDQLKHNDQLRIVVCTNVLSAELLRQAVALISQQEGICILPYNEVGNQFVLTAWVWIRQNFNDLSMILDLIALHNSLSTDDWCVIKVGPAAGCGHHYLLKLDRSVLPMLEHTGGYLNFGHSKIYLRLNKELRIGFDFLSLEMGAYIRHF